MFKKLLKKTEFDHVAQAMLELTMHSMIPLNLWSASPRLYRAEIIGLCHHTLPRKQFMCRPHGMTEEVNS